MTPAEFFFVAQFWIAYGRPLELGEVGDEERDMTDIAAAHGQMAICYLLWDYRRFPRDLQTGLVQLLGAR